jgi:hypothetical protein
MREGIGTRDFLRFLYCFRQVLRFKQVFVEPPEFLSFLPPSAHQAYASQYKRTPRNQQRG